MLHVRLIIKFCAVSAYCFARILRGRYCIHVVSLTFLCIIIYIFFSYFQKVKTEVEDDLNILKQKCEAEQRNHDSVKVYNLFDVLFIQSVVAPDL